jgi:hypothetical protein
LAIPISTRMVVSPEVRAIQLPPDPDARILTLMVLLQ